MNSFQCDDCQHSFYVPGTNQPLVIGGGCPECGGNARPEPDQPSPTRPDGDGRVRNLVDPDTGDDTGGNPLQEGILADGGWQNRRVRDESFASVKQADHGLTPCPNCGGNIKHKQGPCAMCGGMGQVDRNPYSGTPRGDACPMCHGSGSGSSAYECENCHREWPDTDQALKEILPKGIPCPKCGSDMHWRDSSSLTGLHPEGAWECSNQRCWHMMPPGEQAPDAPPEDWGRASSNDPPRDEYVTPMRNHPVANNQTPSLPWQFEVEEVAEPGMDNERAEDKINGHDKKADFGEAAGGAAGSMAGGAAGAAIGEMIDPLGGGIIGGMAGKFLGGAAGRLMGGAMGGGGGGAGASTPPPEAEARPLDMLSSADKPGGGTAGDFPKDTEDPENVDPKEHNDGDNTHFQNDVSVNGMGGTDSSHGFDPDGAGIERLQMLLPLVLHYFHSDESGADDPLIKALHQTLEEENPGYLDQEADPQHLEMVLKLHKPNGPDDSSSLPKAEDREDTEQSDDGKDNDFGHRTHEGANHQGPHSPEQIAAVQQLLMDQGRSEEVPNVPMQPWEYADELAQIAKSPDMPPQDDSAQPQPMQDPAPPENTMPMPGMEAPPPGQFGPATSARQANPEYINVEPNWEGMRRFVLQMARSGDIEHALNVNRELASEALPEEQLYAAASEQVPSADMDWQDPRNSAHEHPHPDNIQGAPAADQRQQQDIEQDTDSSNQWQTNDGDPLVVGEQYELVTPGVDIPDIVRVKAVRPESVTLEFTGAYELGFSKDITRQEFNVMGYQFAPVRGDEPEAQASEDANNAPDNGSVPDFSGLGSGASDSQHQVMTKWRVTDTRESFMPGSPGGTQPGGQCPNCGGPLQPDGSCAGCERSNIAPGAPGVPPVPGGVQNPNGGPPSAPAPAPMNPGGSNPSRPPQSRSPAAYSSVPTHDPETGQLLDEEAQRTIARLMRNAASEASGVYQVPATEVDQVMAGANDRDWLNGDRTAGAHFSPSEQRALIDEQGEARNADKLDLSHTHYEARRHTTADDFMFGV